MKVKQLKSMDFKHCLGRQFPQLTNPHYMNVWLEALGMIYGYKNILPLVGDDNYFVCRLRAGTVGKENQWRRAYYRHLLIIPLIETSRPRFAIPPAHRYDPPDQHALELRSEIPAGR